MILEGLQAVPTVVNITAIQCVGVQAQINLDAANDMGLKCDDNFSILLDHIELLEFQLQHVKFEHNNVTTSNDSLHTKKCISTCEKEKEIIKKYIAVTHKYGKEFCNVNSEPCVSYYEVVESIEMTEYEDDCENKNCITVEEIK